MHWWIPGLTLIGILPLCIGALAIHRAIVRALPHHVARGEVGRFRLMDSAFVALALVATAFTLLVASRHGGVPDYERAIKVEHLLVFVRAGFLVPMAVVILLLSATIHRTATLWAISITVIATACYWATPSRAALEHIAQHAMAPHGLPISGQFVGFQLALVPVTGLVAGVMGFRWFGRAAAFLPGYLIGMLVAMTCFTHFAMPLSLRNLGFALALTVIASPLVVRPGLRDRLRHLAGAEVGEQHSKVGEVGLTALFTSVLLVGAFSSVHDFEAAFNSRFSEQRSVRMVAPSDRNGFDLMGPEFGWKSQDSNVFLPEFSGLHSLAKAVDDTEAERLTYCDSTQEFGEIVDLIGAEKLHSALETKAPFLEAFSRIRDADYYAPVIHGEWQPTSWLALREAMQLLFVRGGLAIVEGRSEDALRDAETLQIFGELSNRGAMAQIMKAHIGRQMAARLLAHYVQRFRDEPEPMRSALGLIQRSRRATLAPFPTAEYAINEHGQNSLLTPNAEELLGVYTYGAGIYTRTADHFIQLEIACALELYRQEHGSYPATLAELVPGLLPFEPRDGFSGEGYVYSADDQGGYVLKPKSLGGISEKLAEPLQLLPTPP